MACSVIVLGRLLRRESFCTVEAAGCMDLIVLRVTAKVTRNARQSRRSNKRKDLFDSNDPHNQYAPGKQAVARLTPTDLFHLSAGAST
jgi:hypothetical protein